jgi:ABC-type lipoprotein export system ATPase subunit
MLPNVFADERQRHANSEIWLCDTREFLPDTNYLISAESGGGKSSLCAYLFGNRNDYEGTLTINGKDARLLTMEQWLEMRRTTIAYLPQDMGLFAPLTAMENIQLKNRLTNHKTQEEIMEMLSVVGMADYANRLAGKLSIGQQQRVAIVRTLCQPFDILLLDEPVSHLDDSSNLAVARLVSREAGAKHAAVIVTSVGNNLRLDNYQHLKL